MTHYIIRAFRRHPPPPWVVCIWGKDWQPYYMLYLVVMAHLHALTFAFWGAVFCNLPYLAISCYLPASRLAWALALTVPNLLLGLLIGALKVSLALAAPALALQLAPLDSKSEYVYP